MDYEYMVCVGGGCPTPEDEVIYDPHRALSRAHELVRDMAPEGLQPEPVQIVVTPKRILHDQPAQTAAERERELDASIGLGVSDRG